MISNGRSLVVFIGLVACIVLVVAVFSREPQPRAPESAAAPTPGARVIPYEDPIQKIELVRENGFVFLTIPVPQGSAGVGYGYRLTTLPSGCVVSRLHAGDDYDVLMWPTGTSIDPDGSIHTNFGFDYDTFRMGQRVNGGRGATVFTADSLDLSEEERAACPGRRYIWLGE